MDKARLISHVLSVDPAVPTYQAAAFALELVERLRNEGRDRTIRLTGATGKLALLPPSILTVREVYADGTLCPQTLDNVHIPPAPATPEGTDWGHYTYITDIDGAMLKELGAYITE